MNAKELAAMLDGREYGKEVTKAECDLAKTYGLVVVFGASDDLMEFRGAIDDELSAFDGTTAYLTSEGLIQNDCENDRCPHFAKIREKAATIEAIWCDGHSDLPVLSWKFNTAIPHEEFKIVEDGEPYCVGIVFALQDVVSKTA